MTARERTRVVYCDCGAQRIAERHMTAISLGFIRCSRCGQKPRMRVQPHFGTVQHDGCAYDVVWREGTTEAR